QPLDRKVADDLKFLEEKAAGGEFSVVSRTRDLQTWVVAFTGDAQPGDYFLYDRQNKKLTHLFEARPEVGKYKLSAMKQGTVKERDGLDLVCSLTLPAGVEPKNLPMVLDVHGGPWARDTWGFNPESQWFANRGYATLQVNYRGSTGFGKKFL